jgi:hypothetical protein
MQLTFGFPEDPLTEPQPRVWTAYERAYLEELRIQRGEEMAIAGRYCSCSYYLRIPCQHRAQLELFDTHGPNCVERGRTGSAYARGTLSHVLHDFTPTNSFALRHRARHPRPAWVTEQIPGGYRLLCHGDPWPFTNA